MGMTNGLTRSAPEPQRVLIVDDQRTFAELLEVAISAYADFECLGVASSPSAAVAIAARERPDLVVMDVHFAGDPEDGLTATAQVRRVSPATRVVLLTGHADRSVLRRAAEAGACSLMPKDGSLPDLLQALRTAGDHGLVVHPVLLRTLMREQKSMPDQQARLSGREVDVLRMLALGMDIKSISAQLGISLNTCRGYVKSLLSKLNAHSQLEAVAVARRQGLLDVEDVARG
jgi:two-component system nitrate/nitrite response regulator NarL